MLALLVAGLLPEVPAHLEALPLVLERRLPPVGVPVDLRARLELTGHARTERPSRRMALARIISHPEARRERVSAESTRSTSRASRLKPPCQTPVALSKWLCYTTLKVLEGHCLS